jgi:hypothetical protein
MLVVKPTAVPPASSSASVLMGIDPSISTIVETVTTNIRKLVENKRWKDLAFFIAEYKPRIVGMLNSHYLSNAPDADSPRLSPLERRFYQEKLLLQQLLSIIDLVTFLTRESLPVAA